VSPYWVFLRKELHDLRRNRQLLVMNLVLPLLFVGMMIAFAALSPEMMRSEAEDPLVKALIAQVTTAPGFAGLPVDATFTAFTLRGLLGFFLLMPVILSSTMAAYSIVGEKQQRTLEPVLATPLTDRELLLGKTLAAVLPAMAITWIAGVVAAIGAGFITWSRWGLLLVPDWHWAIALGVLAPLFCSASVLTTIRMSARATDPQAAAQTSALLLVPGFLLVVGAVGRLLLLSATTGLVIAVPLALVNVWLFRHNVRRFAREEILTRWR
jgi:ABC-2 type transport system permease protein